MLISLLATGCSSDRGAGEARENALRKSSGNVKIGAVWPFAKQNDLFREGLELALEEINEQGVLNGKRIDLVLEDDEASVTAGLSIAQGFADDKSVSAVIGHRSSSVTIPASLIYENAGILQLAPAATSPKLTENNTKLVFRNIPDDVQLGNSLALYAQEKGYKNIAIYYVDDEYGRGLANSFEDKAREAGLHIIDRVSGYKNSADVKRLTDKWAILDCDLVFMAGTTADGTAFIKEMRKAGMTVPVMGGDGLDSKEFASSGSAVEGTVIASIFHPTAPTAQNEQFQKKFKSKYGVEPNKWAAQGYDSLHLLAYAIQKANSRVPSRIAEELYKLKDWEGASGKRVFSEDGNLNSMPIVMKQVRNGTFEYVKR
ncbi:MAG: hypothetical protein K0R67_183 [Paenibacillus sp.]|nr:hypothetical protein [Paenibacillus sp.]